MNVKKLTTLAFTALMVALISLGGWLVLTDAATLEVGQGKTYTTINDAISAALDGDTVRVFPGIYQERVIVDKPLTLEAARGQPIIEAPIAAVPVDAEEAVVIQASNVTVRGFKITAHQDDGVLVVCDFLVVTDNVVIEDNHIQAKEPTAGPKPGIFACRANNLTVRNNIIQNTTGMGIFLGLGEGGTDVINSLIEGNLVVDSVYTGIGLVRGSDNTIRDNDVRSAGTDTNLDDGIRLGVGATYNTVEKNRVSGSSRDGIRAVLAAKGNTIQNNKSTGNARYDIRDDQTTDCDNTWTGNQFETKFGCATD